MILALEGTETWFPLTWASRRQTATARSTTEAEMISLGAGLFGEGIPAQELFETIFQKPVVLECLQGNSAVISIVSAGYSPKLRHMSKTQRIELGSIYEVFEEAGTVLLYIKTDKQRADPRTKNLQPISWPEALKLMGIIPLDKDHQSPLCASVRMSCFQLHQPQHPKLSCSQVHQPLHRSKFINMDRISSVILHSDPGGATVTQSGDSGVWCAVNGPRVAWDRQVVNNLDKDPYLAEDPKLRGHADHIKVASDIATGQAKRWVQLTGIVDQVMLQKPKHLQDTDFKTKAVFHILGYSFESEVREGSNPTYNLKAEVNEEHRRPLEAALRVASRYSTELNSPGAALMVPQLVALVLQRHEHETLKKVVTTWLELKGWTESRALDAGRLTASDVALFVQDSRAPSRVIPSLQFLTKNLYLKLDLTLATALQKATKSAIGIGQHQAPVVQPILLARLEEAIANAIVTDNDKWLGLFGNWCVAMGCVRWAHIQRSRLLQMTQYSLIWECMRGKQRLRRCGFYWSCPRYSVFDGHDFSQAFVNVAETLPSDFAAIAFQLHDHAEIPHRVAKSQVALALAVEVEPDDLRRITSKSWRQLSVTWSFLSELDPTQVCALGNWLDTTEKGVNITPWRYHRGKQQQAQSLKLLLRLCLRSLVVGFKCSSWHNMSPALAKQVLEDQRPMLPDEDNTIVFEQVSTKKLVTEQVVRLRNQVKNNTFLIKLKSTRGVPSSSSELTESPAMDSTAPAGESSEPSDRVPVKARPPLPLQRPALLGSSPRPVLRPAVLPPGVRPAAGARVPVPEPKHPPRRGGVPEPARPPRPALAKASSSMRLPGYAVHDRPHAFNPDEYFDELARNLLARVQHSGDPAPPTMDHNYKEDRLIPAIILGPLAKASMAKFFKEHNVKMVITAFEESLTSRGGSVPEGVCTFQLPLTHYDRDKASVLQAWQYIRKSILPTLEAGESVYIHCMAGVHTAPLAAAAITAMLTKTSFDDQLARIGTLRRIEPHKVIKKPSMKMAMWWLRDLANRQTFQSVLIQLPVVLARSDTPPGGWHVLTTQGSGEPPQPSCRWRQSPGNRKAFFTGGVVTAESVEEALVRERRWCRQCIENLPASFQGVLSNSAFELLK
eukprot:s279_g15.t1